MAAKKAKQAVSSKAKAVAASKVMPDSGEEGANLTDTNGAPEAMDEDGELDESPVLHSLALRTTHAKDNQHPHTEIQAMLHAPTGYETKRLIVPGAVTANRLAALILGVSSW